MMSKIKNTPMPKILFYTADPVLALEVQALHLMYASEFNIMCKRQFSELKSALENYFYEILFLDLSHINDPISTLNIINKLSPATLIFLIDSTVGVDFSTFNKIINQSRVYRIISRPFNFNYHLEDVKAAVDNARGYHKSLYAFTNQPLQIPEDLPSVILLHPDFNFGAKVRTLCEEIAQVSWAANLIDLALLLNRYEPWAIITAGSLPRGDCLYACHVLHTHYPEIMFGMIAKENEKEAVMAGVNYFGLRYVGTEKEFVADMESFLAPLLEGYEDSSIRNGQKYYLQSAKFPPPKEIDPETRDFLIRFETL